MPDIGTKYFTRSDYNKFTGEILNAKIKEQGLVDKSDIFGFIENSNLDKKIERLVGKAELKEEKEIVKLQTFDLSHFQMTK